MFSKKALAERYIIEIIITSDRRESGNLNMLLIMRSACRFTPRDDMESHHFETMPIYNHDN